MGKVKAKVRRSIAKRVKVRSSGKIKRFSANRSHLLAKKSKTRKNRLKKVKDMKKGDARRMLKGLMMA